MIKLPIFKSTSANFSYTIDLEIQLVSLHFVWNIRNGFFHFNFTDEDSRELVGIKVVPNWPLLLINRGSTEFEGDFMVIKDDDSLTDNLTWDNFGAGWNLYYITPDELHDWRNTNGV